MIFLAPAQAHVRVQVITPPASVVSWVRETPVPDFVNDGNYYEGGDADGQRDQIPLNGTGDDGYETSRLHEGFEAGNPARGYRRVAELVHHGGHVVLYCLGVQRSDASLLQCEVQRRLDFEFFPTDSAEFGLASHESVAD